jgi:hypothetical protein
VKWAVEDKESFIERQYISISKPFDDASENNPKEKSLHV